MQLVASPANISICLATGAAQKPNNKPRKAHENPEPKKMRAEQRNAVGGGRGCRKSCNENAPQIGQMAHTKTPFHIRCKAEVGMVTGHEQRAQLLLWPDSVMANGIRSILVSQQLSQLLSFSAALRARRELAQLSHMT